jgi:hypothetical protein
MSDKIRAKIIESNLMTEIITQMKDESWRVRTGAIGAILELAGHGMNLV